MAFVVESAVTDYRLCFVWLPKTGGNSVYRALRCCPLLRSWWAYPEECDHAIPREGLEYDADFVVIRHPKAWWESLFRFWKARQWKDWEPHTWHPLRPLLSCKTDNFATFMHNVLVMRSGFYSRLLDLYCDRPKTVVIRQECLQEGFDEAAAPLGVGRLPLPRLNTSQGPEVAWPDGLLEEMLDRERRAVQRWQSQLAGVT